MEEKEITMEELISLVNDQEGDFIIQIPLEEKQDE